MPESEQNDSLSTSEQNESPPSTQPKANNNKEKMLDYITYPFLIFLVSMIIISVSIITTYSQSYIQSRIALGSCGEENVEHDHLRFKMLHAFEDTFNTSIIVFHIIYLIIFSVVYYNIYKEFTEVMTEYVGNNDTIFSMNGFKKYGPIFLSIGLVVLYISPFFMYIHENHKKDEKRFYEIDQTIKDLYKVSIIIGFIGLLGLIVEYKSLDNSLSLIINLYVQIILTYFLIVLLNYASNLDSNNSNLDKIYNLLGDPRDKLNRAMNVYKLSYQSLILFILVVIIAIYFIKSDKSKDFENFKNSSILLIMFILFEYTSLGSIHATHNVFGFEDKSDSYKEELINLQSWFSSNLVDDSSDDNIEFSSNLNINNDIKILISIDNINNNIKIDNFTYEIGTDNITLKESDSTINIFNNDMREFTQDFESKINSYVLPTLDNIINTNIDAITNTNEDEEAKAKNTAKSNKEQAEYYKIVLTDKLEKIKSLNNLVPVEFIDNFKNIFMIYDDTEAVTNETKHSFKRKIEKAKEYVEKTDGSLIPFSEIVFKDPKMVYSSIYKEISETYNILNPSEKVDNLYGKFIKVSISDQGNNVVHLLHGPKIIIKEYNKEIVNNMNIVDTNRITNINHSIESGFNVDQAINMLDIESSDKYDLLSKYNEAKIKTTNVSMTKEQIKQYAKYLPVVYVKYFDGDVDKAIRYLGNVSNSKILKDVDELNRLRLILGKIEEYDSFIFSPHLYYIMIIMFMFFIIFLYMLLSFIIGEGFFGYNYWNVLTALTIFIVIMGCIFGYIMFARKL